jgi:hypothetical protein
MKSLSLTVGFGLIKDAFRSPVNTMLQESYFATISESSSRHFLRREKNKTR